MYYWLNGKCVTAEEAKIPAITAGTQQGIGAFETILIEQGEIVNFFPHLRRLRQSCESLGYELTWRDEELLFAAKQLISKHPLQRLRITTFEKVCLLQTTPYERPGPTCRLVLGDFVRNEHSPLIGIKSTSYAENILALRKARAAGYDDALLLNTQGLVAETCIANIFCIRKSRIITPSLDSGCLPGIQRERVLALANQLGIETQECPMGLEELMQADELFLTNSLIGIRAVLSIGAHAISEQIGTVTSTLLAHLHGSK